MLARNGKGTNPEAVQHEYSNDAISSNTYTSLIAWQLLVGFAV